MTDPLPDRVRNAFVELCGIEDPEACRRRLFELSAGDDALREEIASLLAFHDPDARFLREPLIGGKPSVADEMAGSDASSTHTSHPERIGGFRILGELGQGGMGTVYRAEQNNPRRVVALKIIRGPTTDVVRRRFEREAHALALLHHPGIARILEVGVAACPWGETPYLAMELIDGVPLMADAQDRGLSVPARLEIFCLLCDAVQHAHGRGVIHRDLKPANVLVARLDTEPAGTTGAQADSAHARSWGPTAQPKILDFGVARLLEPEHGSLTLPGVVVGTLAYMSPEQLAGNGDAVDARSDVYALGVILYELLSGRLPYDLERRGLAEAAHVVQRAEPIQLGAIARGIRGDLESIVTKALEKDLDRRYITASALAEDVRRHLRNEPVHARPPSTTYILGKLLKRHRVAVLAGTAAALVLAGGLAVAVSVNHARQEASNARREAEKRAFDASQRASAASKSLQFFFDGLARATNGRGNDLHRLTLVDAVKAASATMLDRRLFPDEPLAESMYHRGLANACYYSLDLPGVAERHYALALERLIEADRDLPLDVANLRMLRAHTLMRLNRDAEAVAEYEQVIDVLRHSDTDERKGLVTVLQSLANAEMRIEAPEPAVSALQEALALQLDLDPSDTTGLAALQAGLGNALMLAGRLDEAEVELIDATQRATSVGPEARFDAMVPLRYLGRLQALRCQWEESESTRLAVLALADVRRGSRYQNLVGALVELGRLFERQGEAASAESYYRRALEAARASPRPWPENESAVLERLAAVVAMQPGREAEVAELLEEQHRIEEMVMASRHED